MKLRIAVPAILAICALISQADNASAQWNMQPGPWSSGFAGPSRSRPGCGVGASAYFLMPFFDNNTAYVVVNDQETTQSSTDFEWNFQLAPAIWFGFVNEYGSGVRARYFHFDHSSKTLNVAGSDQTINAPPSLDQPGDNSFVSPGVLGTMTGGDQLTFRSGLQLNTGDVEFTYEYQAGPLALLFSGGGRYQRLAQSYDALLTNNVTPGDSEVQRLISESEFNGGGPTVAMQGRWEAGAGWAVFGMLRGALLVGSADRDTTFTQVVIGQFAQNVATQTSTSTTKLLPTAELELGIEYGGGQYSPWLIRGALVNQTYFGAGTAANDSGNLSLFGAQLSVGVAY